ncbi:hypothetical protein QBC44DRAFT_257385 [Cladorrhinum sp. PSN332]|nr:hypothetical protein QBC44DRAFT_257385 [Cladorrhinum sp. PSN332]
MKTTRQLLLLAASGLALGVPGSFRSTSLLKRTDYDVCAADCTLAGLPYPDKNTFSLPLESFYPEQCPPIYVGSDPASPTATGRVCLDFIGPYVVFNFTSINGFTYNDAKVSWKLTGSGSGFSDVTCGPNPNGDGLTCKLPFTTILNVSPTTSTKALWAGICPLGDREALSFDFQFSGDVTSTSSGDVLPLHQQFPCASRNSNRQCTAYKTDYDYTQVAYRCSNCYVAPCPTTSSTTSEPPTSTTEPPTTSTSPPPTLKTCSFGTAFGYQNPVAGVQKSFTLDTQSGAGCNRWGWYETPTLAELQGGISGPLYVGAGGNDITKATDVGIWVATANALGRVTVTYLLNPPYALAEVHVNLVCLPLTRCAPGQYTYNAGAIPNLPTWSNPTPLVYPSCSGGSRAALVVHAAVNVLTVVETCPPPKAT